MTALLRRLRCAVLSHNYMPAYRGYWCVDCGAKLQPRRSS